MEAKDKKHSQLGMNPSTASGRLVKDTLFSLLVECGKNACHQCGEPMSRETFSIEHKTPWLDSEDPVGLYFDQENIAFSHLTCNIKAVRRAVPTCGTRYKYRTGCRCEPCKVAESSACKARYTPEWRKDRYDRTGR